MSEENVIGPLLTEGVEFEFDPLSGRVELEMKGKMPIPSQKYEVTFQNNEDKTEVKGEIHDESYGLQRVRAFDIDDAIIDNVEASTAS
ncbi:hypothetical protein BLNAU_12189 [Blattamonas nauphoetae]|uniref:Uncharacterized protein n=1 Tax=Blattamonas nauphoetae TaxID=2049346 RepID=A0ABQ9XKB2_9EUKA|nr:hypothetical protein BLNAU_12189 [Blattamonas nauphoetae]